MHSSNPLCTCLDCIHLRALAQLKRDANDSLSIRMKQRRKQHREFRTQRLEARLRCPECGGGEKIRVLRRWICRHCLAQMIRP